MPHFKQFFLILCVALFSIASSAQNNQSEFAHLLSSEGGFRFGLPTDTGRATQGSGSFILKDNFAREGEILEYVAMEIGGKWGYVDLKGKIIIPAEYDDAKVYSSGLFAVKKNDKWGYVNSKNEIVIPFKYVSVTPFHYCYKTQRAVAMVLQSYATWEWFLIDKQGNRTSNKTYSDCSGFSSFITSADLIEVKDKNGKRGFIDFNENYVIEPRFDYVYGFSCGVAAVEINDKWGYIDLTGDFVIEPNLKDGGFFREGMLSISMGDGKWGFRDISGNLIGPFDNQYDFYKGTQWKEARAWVKRNGKWGQIDLNGDIKIPFIYDYIRDGGSPSSVVPVKKGGKWGYIDVNTGETVVPFVLDWGASFCLSTGIAAVGYEGKFMYIHNSNMTHFYHTYKEAYEAYESEEAEDYYEDYLMDGLWYYLF